VNGLDAKKQIFPDRNNGNSPRCVFLVELLGNVVSVGVGVVVVVVVVVVRGNSAQTKKLQ